MPIAIQARKEGFKGIILPKVNAKEAAIVDGLDVRGAENILDVINPDSMQILTNALVEKQLASAPAGEAYQFMRTGYFCADSKDHQPGAKPVFNQTVALRETWKK